MNLSKSINENLTNGKVSTKNVSQNMLDFSPKVTQPKIEKNTKQILPTNFKFEVITQVYQTKDYDAFNFFDGNRTVIPRHLADLILSYKDEQLIVPIIVNEKMQIIDGQHRFHAAKTEGKPVYFIICEGYGIKQIQMINSNMKNWSIEDFVDFYCGEGHEPYIIYRDFRIKHGLGHQETLALLLNSTQNFSKLFLDGNLKINDKDIPVAEDMAIKINAFQEYYKGYRRKGFVFAIIKLMKEVSGYDHDEMIIKMSKQTMKMRDCASVTQYLQMLEPIYNYHRRGNPLRFF